MKVTLLAGGTGGTKLAHGIAMLQPAVDLSVIANVGDDFELHGLRICPDTDALLYTLGGLMDTERGWGVRGDTHTALEMLGRVGAPTCSCSATPTWPCMSSAPDAFVPANA